MEAPLPCPRTELKDDSLMPDWLTQGIANDVPDDDAKACHEAGGYPDEERDLQGFGDHAVTSVF